MEHKLRVCEAGHMFVWVGASVWTGFSIEDSSGMKVQFVEDAVWGCGTSLQTPEFRSISASPPKVFLIIPLFLL